MKKIFHGKKKKRISIILIGCLFYFKKHAFKKHKAQNAKKLRNIEENSQAEIQESVEKNFFKPSNI